jgi:hypothetical protein
MAAVLYVLSPSDLVRKISRLCQTSSFGPYLGGLPGSVTRRPTDPSPRRHGAPVRPAARAQGVLKTHTSRGASEQLWVQTLGASTASGATMRPKANCLVAGSRVPGVHGGSRADGGADGAEGLQHTCSQADTGISRQAHAGRRMRVNPVVPLPRATQPRGRRGESEKRARRHGLLPLPPLLGFDEICLDQASARPPPLPNTPGQQGWRYCSLRLRPDLGALPTCRCLAIRISSLSAITSFFGIQFESDRAKSCSGSPGPHCQITSEFSKEREQEYSEYRARR